MTVPNDGRRLRGAQRRRQSRLSLSRLEMQLLSEPARAIRSNAVDTHVDQPPCESRIVDGPGANVLSCHLSPGNKFGVERAGRHQIEAV